MDFNAVEPSDTRGQHSRLCESRDGIGDVLITHRSGQRILPLTVIELHLRSFRADSRGCSGSSFKTVALIQRSSMHELSEYRAIVGANKICHAVPCLGLFDITDPWLEGVALSILLVGVQPFCNDQAKSPFGKSLVVTRNLSGW
ncbi:hypothetical protein D3C81_1743790 [compost metagenome]